MDVEQHLLAAIHHIGKALEARGDLSYEMKRVLDDLDLQFTTMMKLSEGKTERNREAESMLKSAEKKIMELQPDRLKIWDSGQLELVGYLHTIDEVQRLKTSLGSAKQEELADQAHRILQMGMEKLKEVLINILAQNKQSFEHEYKSFYSCEESFGYEKSIVSTEGDSDECTSRRESSSTEPEEFRMDFIHPDVVPCLKSIANVMLSSHYNQEFCKAFVGFWRHALDEYLRLLNVEQISIEDVIKMDWDFLSSNIKKWCQAAKSVFGFFLVSENSLFNQVLGEFGTISSTCFIEATKPSVLCLLNFAQAVAILPLRPERLFSLLDMYEVLADHLPDLNELFAEEGGAIIRAELQTLLSTLGHSAKKIFLEFGDQVASNTSTVPFANGGIPHISKYVMNYVVLVEEYSDTLNSLLEEQDPERSNQSVAAGAGPNIMSYISCPVADHLHALTSILEDKLEKISNLYGDHSLKHIFMMNNIHYMVQKISKSKIRIYFGDEWEKQHIVKFQQHARSYERVTWCNMLLLLANDGAKAKALLKERCRKFSVAFEEIYKIQSRWFIPDVRLRDDLRLKISQNVVPAYRSFVSRIIDSSICERSIKYSVEKLEDHILDLFEGSNKPLSHSRKRRLKQF